jgi:hypothetical protein
MKTLLYWKKGFFNSTYKIYSKENLVGKLTENSWNHSAVGELNGKKYSFKTKGYLRPETQIIDGEKNILIGKITHDSLMSKAIIECSGKITSWVFNSSWNPKWCAFDENGIQVRFEGSASQGTMEFESHDDLLVLTGLYISDYYWQNKDEQ